MVACSAVDTTSSMAGGSAHNPDMCLPLRTSPTPADTELPDINVPGMPFNDEAQELLRQAAAIEAAPSGGREQEAAGEAGRGGVASGSSAGGGGSAAAGGAQDRQLTGAPVHERKGHPERSFPQ